jgi:hypothetical protein
MMESRVQLYLSLNGQEKALPSIPLNYEELLKAVNRETGVFNFHVKLGAVSIASSQDLVVAYLNHNEDKLVFQVEEITPDMGSMDSSSQAMFQSMMDRFKHLATEEKPKGAQLAVTDGTLSKDDLLRVAAAMKEYAQTQLSENSVKFQQRRQELYEVDEEQYRQVVIEQMQFQEMLILSSTVETCNKFGIAPDVFDASCARWFHETEVRRALEEMAAESLQAQGDIPDSLTKEELKRVLTSSCGFINSYIDEHPNMQPMDVLILKIRESDEVMKRFGYNEAQIAAALTRYNIETDPYWEDVRSLLGEVTQKLFKFQGGFPGGPQYPQ